MRSILLALVFAATAFRVHGEGTIRFANSEQTAVYVSESDNSLRFATAKDNLLIGVFYGPGKSPAESLLPAPGLASVGLDPGVMTNAPISFSIPGTEPLQLVSLQVRAWDAALGPDGWRLARAAWQASSGAWSCDEGGKFYGETKVNEFVLAPPDFPFGTIIWQTFNAQDQERFEPLVLHACPDPPVRTNIPPQVVMKWPIQGGFYSDDTYFKMKAEASDPDGRIAQVSFYANAELIGTVSNPPYNVLWRVGTLGIQVTYLKAVAMDDKGATNESRSVRISLSGTRPVFPFVQIVAPSNGMMLPANHSFEFTAEVLTSRFDAGPIEFVVDQIPVGQAEGEPRLSAITPPSSITVSNLAEGDHTLLVRYLGQNGEYCACNQILRSIHVVRLGIHSPRRTPAGHAQFDVVTSYPDRDTIIEASPDLENWMPLATNVPVSTSFIFTDTTSVSASNWFYRARVPAE